MYKNIVYKVIPVLFIIQMVSGCSSLSVSLNKQFRLWHNYADSVRNEEDDKAIKIATSKEFSAGGDLKEHGDFGRNNQNSAVAYAAYHMRINIVNALLDAGFDVNALAHENNFITRESQSMTPLLSVALTSQGLGSSENKRMFELLLRRGADINKFNGEERTVLCLARNISDMKYIIEKGGNIDAKSNNGYTCVLSLISEIKYLQESISDFRKQPQMTMGLSSERWIEKLKKKADPILGRAIYLVNNGIYIEKYSDDYSTVIGILKMVSKHNDINVKELMSAYVNNAK